MAYRDIGSQYYGTVKTRTISLKVLKLFTLFLTSLALSACISHGRQAEVLPVNDDGSTPKKELTIALLGGTGMVGSFILDQALARGYSIRALARTPSKLAALQGHITIVKGDARDPAAIDKLLKDSHLVISALGPVKADGKSTNMLSTTASTLVVQSMKTHNIERYIVVSGAAVDTPGDNRDLTGWMVEQSASLALRETLKDKQSEYRLLADSSIQWTLVRCPLIKPETFVEQAEVSLKTPGSFHLRAGELASFILDEIDSRQFLRRAPFLSSN